MARLKAFDKQLLCPVTAAKSEGDFNITLSIAILVTLHINIKRNPGAGVG